VLENGVQGAPESWEAWGLLGEAYSKLGQVEKACKAYERALSLRPNLSNAQYNLGILYLQKGEFQKAVQTLGSFHQQHPEDAGVLLPYAHCLFQVKRNVEGMEEVNELLAAAPESPEVQSKAGQLLLADGFAQEAMAPLSKAVKLDPQSIGSRLALALALSRTNQPSRVVEILLGHSIPRDPNYPILLGSSLCKLDRCGEAVPILEEAREQFAGAKEICLDLASAYAGSSHDDKALQTLRDARTRWPEDGEIRGKLARQLLRMGSPADALSLLIAKENSPLTPDEQETLTQSYLALNRGDDAERVAEEALTGGNPTEGTLIALANIYQLRGRDPEVVDLLEKHRARFPNSPRYLFTLALSYYNRGNYSVARDLFLKTVSLDPNFAQARYWTGNCLSSLGKPAEAIPQYQAAVQLAPENFLYRFYLGMTLSMVGRKAEAEQQLTKSIGLNGAHAPAHYELAKIYFDSGRAELARQEAEKAIKVGPDFESAYYLLSRVYASLGRRDESAAMLKQFRMLQEKKLEHERRLKEGGLNEKR
jgi:tetratricopeptide (TPR) repeat protein